MVKAAAARTVAATSRRRITTLLLALRQFLGCGVQIDRRNVSPVGDLIPEVAGAVAGVLAGVADGLADDADPGAV